MMEEKRSVLLLEDSEPDCELLALACRKAGLQIDWERAGSCAELRKLTDDIVAEGRAQPCLALLDQRLPDGIGTDQIPVLQERLPLTAIIMMSTSDAPEDRDRVPADAGIGYFVKPFSMADFAPIIAAIAEHLGQQERLENSI